jgi:hypothetical protein
VDSRPHRHAECATNGESERGRHPQSSNDAALAWQPWSCARQPNRLRRCRYPSWARPVALNGSIRLLGDCPGTQAHPCSYDDAWFRSQGWPVIMGRDTPSGPRAMTECTPCVPSDRRETRSSLAAPGGKEETIKNNSTSRLEKMGSLFCPGSKARHLNTFHRIERSVCCDAS